MKKFIKEIRKNVFRIYHKPESDDIALVIIVSFAIGIVLNAIIHS